MASSNLLVILTVVAVVAVALPTVTMGMEFWVGDSSGWTVNFDYQAWAKDKVFYVGDTLVFNYTMGAHNVFKVNGTAFANCIIPPPNEGLRSGRDVISLATPGKKWYICGVENHCADKMQKLSITVEGGAPAPAPSSAFGIATSGYQLLMAAVTLLAIIFVV